MKRVYLVMMRTVDSEDKVYESVLRVFDDKLKAIEYIQSDSRYVYQVNNNTYYDTESRADEQTHLYIEGYSVY